MDDLGVLVLSLEAGVLFEPLQLNAMLRTDTLRQCGRKLFCLLIVGALLTSVNRWWVVVNARARPVGSVSNVSAGLNESVSSMKVVARWVVGVETMARTAVVVVEVVEVTGTAALDAITVSNVVTVANSMISIVLKFVKLLPPVSSWVWWS